MTERQQILQRLMDEHQRALDAFRTASAAFDAAAGAMRETLTAMHAANHAQGEAISAVIAANHEALRLFEGG